jgi:hypothetical protein
MQKRGQVWIETVIYTLMAFAMIAIVLAVTKPQIEKMQDKAIIEKSIEMMKEIDGLVSSAVQSPIGNRQKLEIGIKKGNLIIDAEGDEVRFEIESRYQYSEISTTQSEQKINISSTMTAETVEAGSKTFKVILALNYPNYNLKFDEDDTIAKEIGTTETFHTLLVEHKSREPKFPGYGICDINSDCSEDYMDCNDLTCDVKCKDNLCHYYDKKINLDFTLS